MTGLRHRLAVPLVAAALALTGCTAADDAADAGPRESASPSLSSVTPEVEGPGAQVPYDEALAHALTLIPAGAEAAVFTDFDRIRERLGYADLTSESLRSDRRDFREEAREEAVLLTDGRLSENNSRFELDYGFTQDDVDWELSFTGPDGLSGWALGFRPDLDMKVVERAVKQGEDPFANAAVDGNTVIAGSIAGDPALDDTDSWSDLDEVMATVRRRTESLYLRYGSPACLPLADVLGPDAGSEVADDVRSNYELTEFGNFRTLSFAFDGDEALAAMSYPGKRASLDAELRAELTDGWPASDGVAFSDGFGTVIEGSARKRKHEVALLEFPVLDHAVAARLTLTDHLPFAVCSEAG